MASVGYRAGRSRPIAVRRRRRRPAPKAQRLLPKVPLPRRARARRSIIGAIVAAMTAAIVMKAAIGKAAIGLIGKIDKSGLIVRRGPSSARSGRIGPSVTSGGSRVATVHHASAATGRIAIRSCAPSTSKAATDVIGASASASASPIRIRHSPSSRRSRPSSRPRRADEGWWLDRQRIDKWLWHARVVRTRSAAAALAGSGHVRVNGARVSAASHAVKAGDVVTVALDRSVRVLKIVAFAERRGDAAAGRALYDDLSGPPPERPQEPAARMPGSGRPTKRERRAMRRFTGEPEP